MQVTPYTTLKVEYTEKEYSVVCKALAIVAGTHPSLRITPEEKAEAERLNADALRQQEIIYEQKLNQTQNKRSLAERAVSAAV